MNIFLHNAFGMSTRHWLELVKTWELNIRRENEGRQILLGDSFLG